MGCNDQLNDTRISGIQNMPVTVAENMSGCAYLNHQD